MFHLDTLLWEPNWKQVGKDQQKTIQINIVQKDQWIIDGNYGGTMDIRFQYADTVIFMDIPRVICIYRAVKRRFEYRNKTRPDMVKGNRERFDLDFYKWVWNYPRERRPEILEKLNRMRDEKNIIRLNSLREVQEFIDKL